LFFFFQSVRKLCSSLFAFFALRFNLIFDKLLFTALLKQFHTVSYGTVHYWTLTFLTFFTAFFFIKTSFSFLYTSIFLFVSSTSMLFARFQTTKEKTALGSSAWSLCGKNAK
jgi:hypothetical protein